MNKKIINRKQKQPSFAPSEEDRQCVLVGNFKFFPEDIKKMEKMSKSEAREYSANLVMENKFIKD